MPEPTFPKIVLVVDDEAAILQLMKAQLETAGFAAILERTGLGACEAVKNTQLHAVLLDLGLPDMSGFEVLRAIKAIKPELPVLVVTGNHQESEARKALELGAWDYLTKPIDFKYLKNILLFQAPGA